MINVFKKRTRLYALTTSALFLLQGVDSSIGASWFSSTLSTLTQVLPSFGSSERSVETPPAPRAEKITGVPSAGVPSAGEPSAGVPSAGEPSAGEPSVGEPSVGGGSQDIPSSLGVPQLKSASVVSTCFQSNSKPTAPIFCNDGEEHKYYEGSDNGSFILKAGKYDHVIHVKSLPSAESSSPTLVDLLDVYIIAEEDGGKALNVEDVNKQIQIGRGDRGAVLADGVGAKIELEDALVDGFIFGLGAFNSGEIAVSSSSLENDYVNALASSEGIIVLDDVEVEVKSVGLWSDSKSLIVMDGGITLDRSGVGVIASEMGIVQLGGTKISQKESFARRYSGSDDSDEGSSSSTNDRVVLLSQGGYIALNGGKVSVSDATFLQIVGKVDSLENTLEEDLAEIAKNMGTFPSVIDNDEGSLSEEYSRAFRDITFGVRDVVRHADIVLGTEASPSDLDLNAAIRYSTNKILGKGSYGIYFDGARGERHEDTSLHTVLLQNTTLKVPEGIAIYSNGLNSSVFLQEESEVSGGLLLKAEKSADLSVFASDSVINGATRVDENAHAKLFLSHGTEWYVTKSSYEDFGDSDPRCIDSCISFVSLINSDIRFFTSLKNGGKNGGNGDIEYRTLRVGEGRGTVYSAQGASRVHFNVGLVANNASSGQVSDRLLIHGDVKGRTTVYVQDKSTGLNSENGKGHRISLIQVFGEAEDSSFILNGGYVTLGGQPYKYVLRAYGPTIPPQMQYFDKTLVRNSQDVWDFRLEDENLPYERGVTFFLGGTTVNAPSVPLSHNSVRNEVDEPPVVSSLPSGDSESRESNQVINSGTDRNPAQLLRSELVGEDDTRTDNPDMNLGDVSTPLPSAENRLMVTAGEDGLTQTVEISVTPDVSERSQSVVPSTPNSLLRSDTGDEDNTGGGYDGVVDEASETITSIPSSTTSSVTSTVSEGNASTDLGGAGISEVASNSSSIAPAASAPAASAPAASAPAASAPAASKEKTSANTVLSNSSPSSRGRGLVTLRTSGANSVGRSDTGRESVISADGISLGSGYHTVSNRIIPIKSVASMSSSASVVSEKSAAPSSDTPAASSNGAVGRTLVLNGAKKTISSQCGDATQGSGAGRSQTPYLCSDGQTRTVTNLTLKASEATQHSVHATNQNTIINLEGASISSADSSNLDSSIDLVPSMLVTAVLAEKKAEVVLSKNSTIQSSVIGLEAQSGGKVQMTGGTVNARYVGALAGSGSSVNLKDTTINVTGDLAAAGLASQAGEITMNTGAITLAKGVAVRSEAGGSVKLDKVNITVKDEAGKLDSAENFGRAAFLLSDNASIDFKNGSVVTDSHALWVRKGDDVIETGSSRKRRSSEARSAMNHANIEASTVRVEGDGTYGIYFDGGIQKEASEQNRSKDLAAEKANVVKRSTVSKQEKTPIGITGAISLKKTDFEVANGIAIYGNNSGGQVSLENKTTLAGDLLLKAENDSNVLVSVDNSIVTGAVRVDKSSYTKLGLANKSQWILKRSAQRNLGTPDLGCVDSCISSVSLVNSAIDFKSSESEGKYQTLHIGNGKGTVYEAQGDAVIHLNARLNPHDPSDQQVTDRLVIHGDVSGKTKIHVRGDAGNGGDAKAKAKIAHSVSVIQVYGQAKKDSFQLNGNYVALRNSPYKYTLRAYGPEATSKQEHVQQKFVRDGGEFWNFRLENQYVKSAGFAALPEQFVRSVVPQVPTYLVLPNSVFHAGLMDINNQNKQMETLRMTSTGMVEVRENPALYLRGYGGSYRYATNLSALEYGYGGDLDYHGVEAGVLLQTIENADSALSFGVMGTYGKLSLQPLDVEQSQKSAFDKWTATVYGSMQRNVGFYVDGLLSYGLFKGDVLTLARGKTATLKANPLSVSLSGGQTIETGYKGFVFDPQVQVVYQHLQFNKARDIDNFDIEMGNLDQWVARVGGRLTRTPTGSEGVDAVAFYGKLYLAHGFGEKQSVRFNDAFKLGAFGSSLEAGLGFNAKLLPQFSLHADVLYQHKLNKSGFSGASFSGGVRYQF
ncbi:MULTISPECIES: autotransporter outer membrane beta-barrel domain-containing protein [Bartonella]|uniref:autotransporter outer membrane beta-barrel domain-containing protein n=1 Tax=Bartonella TaxID=773 RepID=UPI002360D9AA|nr:MULTISPECIES: autotransporter outer membrane beta-barrel domain-containing protein [Bartonella]